jgi:hypothetical protein
MKGDEMNSLKVILAILALGLGATQLEAARERSERREKRSTRSLNGTKVKREEKVVESSRGNRKKVTKEETVSKKKPGQKRKKYKTVKRTERGY